MSWKSALAAIAVLAPSYARAGPVASAVGGADGRPRANAVVMIEVPGIPPAAARRAYAVAQRNIAFDPRVLIVPLGATVGFPNFDKVRHHVYSFSKPKRFELKLYGREDNRNVTFDKPGAVALGCNIHDEMSGVIYVTATPFAALSDAAGRVAWPDVPAGRATLKVWHPTIRAADNVAVQAIAIAPSGYATTYTIRR